MLEFTVNFLAATIRTATPLLIAALGLVYSERAGIVNIGTEGIMLTGALLGAVGSLMFTSPYVGAVFAILGGATLGMLFAFFTVTLRASQVVVGFSLNIFTAGLTVTLNRLLLNQVRVPGFTSYSLPGLSRIPVVGTLFSWPLLVYFALLAVPIASFVLYKTNIGLKIRAVGDHPKACDTVGINVFRVRYSAIIFSGAMSGLAGAFISMGQLSMFTEGMVAGGGFMALAIVVFGNYSPGMVLFASLLFGASDALKFRLLMTPIGGSISQFMNMLPYALAIIALCLIAKRSNRPAFSAVPYKKD